MDNISSGFTGGRTTPESLFRLLRSRAQLTQEELSGQMALNIKVIRNWEGGRSLPRAENLKRLVAFYLERTTFTDGLENEEIRKLWQTVKAAFDTRTPYLTEFQALDEGWLTTLIGKYNRAQLAKNPPVSGKLNLGDAPDVEAFAGREAELQLVQNWILNERTRLVVLVGIGGIGKTSLSVKLAHLMAPRFEFVIWRSLTNAPGFETLLSGILRVLGYEQPGEEIGDPLSVLLEYFRQHRVLLVLDNLETIMYDGDQSRTGQFRRGFEKYQKLLELAATTHQSCVLLTSREKPLVMSRLEGTGSGSRTFKVPGLKNRTVRVILSEKKLYGSEPGWENFIQRYSGNPLALKLVAETILEVFQGNIDDFLGCDRTVFGDIQDVLKGQFQRLSPREQEIIYWLALSRAPLSLDELVEDLRLEVPTGDLLETLGSLKRRSLLESGLTGNTFTLQPVVMAYATEQVVEQVAGELLEGRFEILASHALLKAQAQDFVRQAQARLVLKPILHRLSRQLKSEGVEEWLVKLLGRLRRLPPRSQGFAGGNLVNLLYRQKGDLKGLNLSGLVLWQANFQGVEMQQADLRGAEIKHSLFTETFDGILSLAFSPDGKLLAAGDINGDIRMWNAATGHLLMRLSGHTNWVWCVNFSPDGKLLASAGHDHQVRVWDIAAGECLQTLTDHRDFVWWVSFSPDGKFLASAGHDHAIRIREVETGLPVEVLEDPAGAAVWCLAFSPDGKWLISGGDDYCLKFWNLAENRCKRVVPAHNNIVCMLAFSPDGKWLASAGSDNSIKLWNPESGRLERDLATGEDRIWSVAVSPDGQYVAGGSEEGAIRLWNSATGECMATLLDAPGWIRSLAFSPDGKLLASAGDGQVIKLWDLEARQCIRTMQGYTSEVEAVAFSPDGKLLASATSGQSISLWEVEQWRSGRVLKGHNSWIWSARFSPDGKYLATGSHDRTIILWEMPDGRAVQTLGRHNRLIWAAVFSPDSRYLAAGCYDRKMRLWSVEDGRQVLQMEGDSGLSWCLDFSPDGKYLAAGGDNHKVYLWDSASGQQLNRLEGHAGQIWSLAFNPAGSLLASGGDDGRVRLWEISSGCCAAVYPVLGSRVRALAFSPDGKWLAVGGFREFIEVLETSTGKVSARLALGSQRTRALAFSPDGKWLVAGNVNGQVRLWELPTLSPGPLLQHERPYEGLLIRGISGLSPAQKDTLLVLGAAE